MGPATSDLLVPVSVRYSTPAAEEDPTSGSAQLLELLEAQEPERSSDARTIEFNAETAEAMTDAVLGRNLSTFSSVDEYFKSLE